MDGRRIELLDALRGLGVLGILTVNASYAAATFAQTTDLQDWPFPNTGASLGLWAFVHVFCDSKFITLFAMLFGVSTYLVGGEPGDPRRSANLNRRFAWLAVFGLIHGMAIWYGDILLDYAACGAMVMGLRGWSARRLIVAGLAGFFLGVAAMTALGLVGDAHPAIYSFLAPGHAPKALAFQAGFAASLQANLATWAHYRLLLAVFTIPYAAPLMLVGLGLFKAGALTGGLSPRLYAGAVVVGALAVVGYGLFAALYVLSGFADRYGRWDDLLINLTSPLISLAYASGLILMARGRARGWIIGLLAPLGRMAFTNYVSQSILLTMIFYGGRGLGLFDRVDRPGLALVVVSIWALQLAWSRLWLQRFDCGLFEWVWRCLTYARALPLRRPVVADIRAGA